jgi:hypothetical protein
MTAMLLATVASRIAAMPIGQPMPFFMVFLPGRPEPATSPVRPCPTALAGATARQW